MKMKKMKVVIEATEAEKKILHDFSDTLQDICNSFDNCENCPFYSYRDCHENWECPIYNNVINDIFKAFELK